MLPSFLNFLDVFLVMVIGSKGGIGIGAIALLARRLPRQLLRRLPRLNLCGMDLLQLGLPTNLDMALEYWS